MEDFHDLWVHSDLHFSLQFSSFISLSNLELNPVIELLSKDGVENVTYVLPRHLQEFLRETW